MEKQSDKWIVLDKSGNKINTETELPLYSKIVKKKQMKLLLLIFISGIIVIGCSSNTENKNQNTVDEFDALFTEISTDSLHVFASGYRYNNNLKEWSRKIIPNNLIKSHNINPESSVALGKLFFDAKKEMIGYLIGNNDQNHVFLYIYSREKQKNIFDLTVASNTCLEGSYEEIQNSWIIDLNKDGRLDIVIWKRLTDFEFPNEYSENISKVERFCHINLGHQFEYDTRKTKILTTVVLEK